MGGQSHRQPNRVATTVSRILRATSLCAVAACIDAPVTLAAPPESPSLTAAIPAEPLAQALEAFAFQTGLQLVYVSEIVREQRSQAVPAGLGAADALAQMLKGTGLQFEPLTAGSIRILAGVAGPPRATMTEAPAAEALQEVIVTANRRAEKLQNVPITIQVLSGDELQEFHLNTFEDAIKYTPNVTYSGNGPGTGNIFIRGLGSPGTGDQSQSTIAPFPNVALYLDEQAMQFPARNNDVYIVDLQRIEVLEGPQGTLYGGGAQAGAIRYITNKPRTDTLKSKVNAGYGITAGGDPNYSANATFNLPLIPDRFAVRAVGFVDRRGGYISNVPGTISFDIPLDGVRLVSPVANNADLVGSNTNSLTYRGFRLSALYRFNDDWDLLIQQSYQSMQADGSFYAYPADSNGRALQPNQITAFTPAYTQDRYESTAWTFNGRLGDLQAIYAGSYMRRHIDEQQDYSNYLRGTGGTYYDCIGAGAGYFNPANFPDSHLEGKPLQCYAPVGAWYDSVQNVHQSHEVRLSTPDEYRLRGLLGAYWENFVIYDDMNFDYLGIPQCSAANLAISLAGGPDCLSAVGPLPDTHTSNPALRENMNDAFGEDVRRGYKQYAFFTSVDFDIIPKILTLTAGTRFYHYDEFEEGSTWFTASDNSLVVNHLNGACTATSQCGDPLNLSSSESGFRSRANLTWHAAPDIMLYYTFSQGFRPGGFNRIRSEAGQPVQQQGILGYCGIADSACHSLLGKYTFQYVRPIGFNSDNLINNELGFKGEFLDHRLRVNAAAYLMRWEGVQSLGLGLINVYLNGPTYTAKGLELQLLARVTEGLTLQAASSWNSAKQSDVPCIKSSGITPGTPNNPTPAGQCIIQVSGRPYTGAGALNTPAPFAPPLIFNLRARYAWNGSVYKPFAWVAMSHVAEQNNEPGNYPDANAPDTALLPGLLKYRIPAYTTYDAGAGLTKENWTVQATGSNLSNSNAATNISSAQFITATIPLRPRVLTLSLSYTF
jgi:iron complex outermembrane receptor protein